MAVGTTRNEQAHHVLNSHFHGTVCVSKRTLAAEMRTWLCTEQAVFKRVLQSKRTRKVSRADMVALVSASTTVFTDKAWQSQLATPQAEWVGDTNDLRRKRQPRRGPTEEQAEVYDAIRSKLVKRLRSSIYRSSATK